MNGHLWNPGILYHLTLQWLLAAVTGVLTPVKQKVRTPMSLPWGQGCESGFTGKAVWVGPGGRLSCLGKDACYRFVHTVLAGDEEWGCCCIWYIDISTVVKDKDFSPFGSAVLFLASLVWSYRQPHSRRRLSSLCQGRWRNGLEEIGFEHWVKNTNKHINVRNL